MATIEELVAQHNRLTGEQRLIASNVTHVKSELASRRGALKQVMEEAREAGLDPNNLDADIRRDSEVLKVKLDTFESELRDARKLVDPMLKEIGNG